MSTTKINIDYDAFARQYAELTAKAQLIFERHKTYLNKNLRHEITGIAFTEHGAEISYESRHCSNCSPDRDTLYISAEELLGQAFSAEI